MSKSDVYSLNTEKGMLEHREDAVIPATIREEDENDENEHGNVGAAAYEKSKHMAEIVSLDVERRSVAVLTRFLSDPGTKPRHLAKDRFLHSASLLVDS